MKKLLCGIGLLLCCGGTLSAQPEVIADPNIPIAVSYTHLTLPTILLV